MKVICQKRSAHVTEIILNRPEKRNAVDFDVIKQLTDCLQRLKTDKTISVLVIRGAGESFCSGGDLHSFHSLQTKEDALTMLSPMCEVLKLIATFPAITVSLLNGTAVGGGAEIASATDYRLSLNRGVLGFIQGNLHITTGWGGASLLKKRVGKENALSMLATANKFTMAEAYDFGFIQVFIDDVSEVDNWARQWIDPEVVQAYKRVLHTKKEQQELFLAMDEEIEACASLWESESHHLAVNTFLTKKK
ncbi:enoyl-CoA hydratase/isomerase family protein [Evansella sp. AB-rgal1]|uniref:enoyl-CoA hydratase/isomerase family protein n=1 Tax=Evansella sp. AB-rgal1 TaxID=3242696 RepID=UPI00359D834B